jgi:hypothetical protein
MAGGPRAPAGDDDGAADNAKEVVEDLFDRLVMAYATLEIDRARFVTASDCQRSMQVAPEPWSPANWHLGGDEGRTGTRHALEQRQRQVAMGMDAVLEVTR